MSIPLLPASSPLPRHHWTMPFYAATMTTFMAASSAPTPLYRIYQQNWGFSAVVLTLIFGVYAFALLISLLIAGSLSDHIGRRPVIFGALLVQAVALLMFIFAGSPSVLIAARIVQGFATGVAMSSIGAALVDVNAVRGPIINSITPLLGMAAGALGASALVQYAPEPMRFVYLLLLIIIVAQALIIWLLPETATRRDGALNSLWPQVRVPAHVRRALLSITPINVAVWSLGGFYLSLVPSLITTTTGITSPMIGGLVVSALTLSGAASVYLLQTAPAARIIPFGTSIMILGVLTVLAGVQMTSVSLLFAGTVIAGTGFGASFLGCVRTIMPLAAPNERAELLAAFYIQSYLAFSIPAIGAGMLARSIGYVATTDIYATLIILLTIGGFAATRRMAPTPVT